MRVAAIYDIHGNLPALEAVLRDIRGVGVDQIVVGGDVFPGPMPVETIECLLGVEIPLQFIRGNGDREVLAQIAGAETDWFRAAAVAALEPIRWTARQLRRKHEALIASWAATLHVEIPGLGNVLFCHATPRSDTEIVTRFAPESRLSSLFAAHGASLIVCGHTHMQFDLTIGSTRVVNAGSVGMPFGVAGAYWLLLGPDVRLQRTSYDLEAAAELIRSTEYPQAHDFAENNVLNPPSEKAMIAVFQS